MKVWFNNLSIRRKIYLFFGFVLILVFVLGISTTVNLLNINNLSASTHLWLEKTLSINNISNDINAYRRRELNFVLLESKEQKKLILKDINKLKDELKNEFAIYQSMLESEDEKYLFKELEHNWTNYVSYSNEIVNIVYNDIRDYSIDILVNQSRDEFYKVQSKLDSIISYNKLNGDNSIHSATEINAQTRNYIIFQFSIILMIVFAFGYVLARIIAEPLKKLTVIAEKISKGSNQIEFDFSREDEIGKLAKSFRSSIDYFHEIAVGMACQSAGDFSYILTPKSNDDLLGNAFVETNKQLQYLYESYNQLNSYLEQMVRDRTEELEKERIMMVSLIDSIPDLIYS